MLISPSRPKLEEGKRNEQEEEERGKGFLELSESSKNENPGLSCCNSAT
jgi:hypothetical protein